MRCEVSERGALLRREVRLPWDADRLRQGMHRHLSRRLQLRGVRHDLRDANRRASSAGPYGLRVWKLRVRSSSTAPMAIARRGANCNTTLDDGCETNTATDSNNCGSCGAKCAPGQICLVQGWDPPKNVRLRSGANALRVRRQPVLRATFRTALATAAHAATSVLGAVRNGSPVCRKRVLRLRLRSRIG